MQAKPTWKIESARTIEKLQVFSQSTAVCTTSFILPIGTSFSDGLQTCSEVTRPSHAEGRESSRIQFRERECRGRDPLFLHAPHVDLLCSESVAHESDRRQTIQRRRGSGNYAAAFIFLSAAAFTSS